MREGPLASRFRRRVTVVLLIAYSALVAIVTLSPRMPGTGTVERLVRRVLSELHQRELFTTIDYAAVEFVGNVLLFVPLGVFVAMLLPQRAWWVLLLIGIFCSALIEAAQAVFLLDRVADPRDVIANSLGFLIGAAAAIGFRLIVAHRDRLVARDLAAQHSVQR